MSSNSPQTPSLGISELVAYDTADGVYNNTWSESHDSIVVAAIADDSVNLICSFHEHTREVHSADYNPVRRDSFLSSSWDDTVKLWILNCPISVHTFKECRIYWKSFFPPKMPIWVPKFGYRICRPSKSYKLYLIKRRRRRRT